MCPSKMLAKRGTTKVQQDEDGPRPDGGQQRRINHGRDDVVAQVVARALEFGQALEDDGQRAGGFARAHHVDVELGK
jgi:hypothetical protein